MKYYYSPEFEFSVFPKEDILAKSDALVEADDLFEDDEDEND